MSANIPTTFLELSQATVQECGVSGTLSTVLNQTGELGRIVAWVSRAWVRIQNRHKDWKFLRSETSWPTVFGQAQYTPTQAGIPNGVQVRWNRQTFRNYVTAAGQDSEFIMNVIDYDVWRNAYFYGALRDVRSRPVECAIGPDKSIWLGPVPADGYTMEAHYYLEAAELVNDGDQPTLPVPDRMIIVYRAMQFYGRYEGAPEVYDAGKHEYEKMLAQLEKEYLKEVFLGDALA